MDAITQDDCPFDLPAPREVAERCMARAWDDDTDDASRLVLEAANAAAEIKLRGRNGMRAKC